MLYQHTDLLKYDILSESPERSKILLARYEKTNHIIITFRVRHSRGEMYIGHSCLCVSLCVYPSPHSYSIAWIQM